MLGLLLLLASLGDPPTSATPALIASLPAAYVGIANEPGACRGAQSSGFGVSAMTAKPASVIVHLLGDPGAGRVGGCNSDLAYPLIEHRLSLPDLRPLKDPTPAADLVALSDLVTHRCVNRKTLRPYTSLVLLGAPLQGYAIEVSPSRNITTLRLIDARGAPSSPAKVEVLGKAGVRTLEWCDRTDVAEGHCPNPAQGEIRQVVLAGDHLVLTMALGFADVCGQDDLVVKAFALPAAVRRSLQR